MSTLSRIIAEREAAAKKKPAKKKAAKRDENGRYVKQETTTPGEE
tara:strand:- start:98 stop:232 length:135 start_codon:yes stop_codon:yes gene_type:complete